MKVIELLNITGIDLNYQDSVRFRPTALDLDSAASFNDHYHYTQYGWTALHCASQFGHSDIVKLLLDKNANTHIKDKVFDNIPIVYNCIAHSSIPLLLFLNSAVG